MRTKTEDVVFVYQSSLKNASGLPGPFTNRHFELPTRHRKLKCWQLPNGFHWLFDWLNCNSILNCLLFKIAVINFRHIWKTMVQWRRYYNRIVHSDRVNGYIVCCFCRDSSLLLSLLFSSRSPRKAWLVKWKK